jgi:hypothetical protein
MTRIRVLDYMTKLSGLSFFRRVWLRLDLIADDPGVESDLLPKDWAARTRLSGATAAPRRHRTRTVSSGTRAASRG